MPCSSRHRGRLTNRPGDRSPASSTTIRSVPPANGRACGCAASSASACGSVSGLDSWKCSRSGIMSSSAGRTGARPRGPPRRSACSRCSGTDCPRVRPGCRRRSDRGCASSRSHGGQDHPGRADAALGAAVLEKRLPGSRAGSPSCRDPFDGGDRRAGGMRQRRQAAVHQAAVEQHAAGAALPFAAAFLGAGQPAGRAARRAAAPSDGRAAPCARPLTVQLTCRQAMPRLQHCHQALRRQRQAGYVDPPVACATALRIAGAGAVHRQLADALGAAPGRSAYGTSTNSTRMGGRSIEVGMM